MRTCQSGHERANRRGFLDRITRLSEDNNLSKLFKNNSPSSCSITITSMAPLNVAGLIEFHVLETEPLILRTYCMVSEGPQHPGGRVLWKRQAPELLAGQRRRREGRQSENGRGKQTVGSRKLEESPLLNGPCDTQLTRSSCITITTTTQSWRNKAARLKHQSSNVTRCRAPK